jgi:hypothetical protein
MARRKYGPGRFLVDLVLGFVTGGIWWMWIAFRFLRENV